jgi:DNA-binding GntR family transcriptional regulator
MVAGQQVEASASRAYKHVKAAILRQEYEGGALLTEGEIAERLGISRTPVREALLRLEGEGLVRLYPKKGALVQPVSAQEIADVMEMRQLIEGYAAERAWPQRAALAGELTALLDDMRGHLDAGDVSALMAADRRFHSAIVAAAGNRILVAVYDGLRDRQMRMGVAAMRIAPERMQRAVDEHSALLAELRSGDSAAFLAQVRDHVTSAADHLRSLR